MSKSSSVLVIVGLIFCLLFLLSPPLNNVEAYVDPSSGISAISPSPLTPGTLDVTFDVYYYGGTFANEYMERFDVTLPASWTINNVYHLTPNTQSACGNRYSQAGSGRSPMPGWRSSTVRSSCRA